MNEAPQAAPAVVEADRQMRQDQVLIIDKDGIHAVIDGVRHRLSDGRGLRGFALQCLIADIERD